MKILLLYFSGTGNTAHYSGLIARELLSRGHSCEAVDIESAVDTRRLWAAKPVVHDYMLEAERRVPLGTPPGTPEGAFTAGVGDDFAMGGLSSALDEICKKISMADVIGFGSPVYFFRPAPVFESFIRSLSPSPGKPAFSYGTHMEGPIGYPETMRSLLSAKGFDVAGHADDYIMHSELIPAIPAGLYSEGLAKAYYGYRIPAVKAGIRRFLDSIGLARGSRSLARAAARTSGPLMRAAGRVIELALYASFPIAIGSLMRRDRCTRCGLCVSGCPIGAIGTDGEGFAVRRSHCMYCLRCLNSCPSRAVLFTPVYDLTARFVGFDRLGARNRARK